MRFTQIERPTEEHQRIIIALITARAKEGATVSEIKSTSQQKTLKKSFKNQI